MRLQIIIVLIQQSYPFQGNCTQQVFCTCGAYHSMGKMCFDMWICIWFTLLYLTFLIFLYKCIKKPLTYFLFVITLTDLVPHNIYTDSYGRFFCPTYTSKLLIICCIILLCYSPLLFYFVLSIPHVLQLISVLLYWSIKKFHLILSFYPMI